MPRELEEGLARASSLSILQVLSVREQRLEVAGDDGRALLSVHRRRRLASKVCFTVFMVFFVVFSLFGSVWLGITLVGLLRGGTGLPSHGWYQCVDAVIVMSSFIVGTCVFPALVAVSLWPRGALIVTGAAEGSPRIKIVSTRKNQIRRRQYLAIDGEGRILAAFAQQPSLDPSSGSWALFMRPDAPPVLIAEADTQAPDEASLVGQFAYLLTRGVRGHWDFDLLDPETEGVVGRFVRSTGIRGMQLIEFAGGERRDPDLVLAIVSMCTTIDFVTRTKKSV